MSSITIQKPTNQPQYLAPLPTENSPTPPRAGFLLESNSRNTCHYRFVFADYEYSPLFKRILTGADLLSKVKNLGDVSKTDLANACGYGTSNYEVVANQVGSAFTSTVSS